MITTVMPGIEDDWYGIEDDKGRTFRVFGADVAMYRHAFSRELESVEPRHGIVDSLRGGGSDWPKIEDIRGADNGSGYAIVVDGDVVAQLTPAELKTLLWPNTAG